jgi:hypothetical protein
MKTIINYLLDELKSNVYKRFSDIVRENGKVELFSQTDFDNGDTPDDYYERRVESSGQVIECFILSVDENGLVTIDADEDHRKKKVIKYSDLACVESQVQLVNSMESIT